MPAAQDILWFKDIHSEDIGLVGEKGVELAELSKVKGIHAPKGFVVTSEMYQEFLDTGDLRNRIKSWLTEVDFTKPAQVAQAAKHITSWIRKTEIPPSLVKPLFKAYFKLSKSRFKHSVVAVRPSITSNRLAGRTHAGHMKSYLDVQGESSVAEAIRNCWAAMFEQRMLQYRADHRISQLGSQIAVVIQEMVDGEVSGTLFTVDPLTRQKNVSVIEAIYGLGSLMTEGKQTPDHYEINKFSQTIIRKQIEPQRYGLVRGRRGPDKRKVAKTLVGKQKLSDEQIIELTQLGKNLEQYFMAPYEIEWVWLDKIFHVVRIKPLTELTEVERKNLALIEQNESSLKQLPQLASGLGAAPGLATGYVKLVRNKSDLLKIKRGDILVTSMTDQAFLPAVKLAKAIVTDKGGLTSHAALVARELGITCVVDTNNATRVLKPKTVVTVDGKTGVIFKGSAKISRKKVSATLPDTKKVVENKESPPVTATHIMTSLVGADQAAHAASLPSSGVGLLNLHKVLTETGVHPYELDHNSLVDSLTAALENVCTPFIDRPVVYQLSNLLSHELRSLKHGKQYETDDNTGLLGHHGAARQLQNPHLLELELQAVKYCRNKLKLRNLSLALPFVRSPQELLEIKRLIGAAGLIRSPSFNLWLMIETPAQIIELGRFIRVGIDGIAINSGRLLSLMYGCDLTKEDFSSPYLSNPQVMNWAFDQIVSQAKSFKMPVSLVSINPIPDSIVSHLVQIGISHLSVPTQQLEHVRQLVAKAEEQLITQKS